jgi:hypothetical protein
MAKPLSLYIGSIEIPQTFLLIDQSYTKLSAYDDQRMADGALYRRTHWSGKLSSSITVEGTDASALNGIDFDDYLLLKCVAPLGITKNSTTITLPTARRSDTGAEPYAKAYVSGTWTECSVSLASDTLTITPVAGATNYRAFYYPQFNAFFQQPEESFSQGIVSSWSITCEEI